MCGNYFRSTLIVIYKNAYGYIIYLLLYQYNLR